MKLHFSEEASINYLSRSSALCQRRAISYGDKTGVPATLFPKFFLPRSRRQIDRSPYDPPWSRARLHVGDTSRDLMDSTAILSYERTNYVIKDKNKWYLHARSHVCTLYSSSPPHGISMPWKIGNFYTQVLLSRRYVKGWRKIAVQEIWHVTALWIYLQRN